MVRRGEVGRGGGKEGVSWGEVGARWGRGGCEKDVRRSEEVMRRM